MNEKNEKTENEQKTNKESNSNDKCEKQKTKLILINFSLITFSKDLSKTEDSIYLVLIKDLKENFELREKYDEKIQLLKLQEKKLEEDPIFLVKKEGLKTEERLELKFLQ